MCKPDEAAELHGEIARLRRQLTEMEETAAKSVEAAEELRRSEKWFRTIANFTSDWENWVGADGRPIWISPAVLRITGYSPEECMAMPHFLSELVEESDRPRMARLFAEAVTGSCGNDVEFPLRRKDGSLRWVSVSWQPVLDDRGVNLGHRSSIRDISDRRRAEEALKESEEKFRNIVDTAREGVWVIDESYLTTFVNAKMAEMLGYKPDEMTGRRVEDFMFPEDVEDFWTKMEERKHGRVGQYERRYIHRDGREIWTIVSANSLITDEGRFRGSFAMITDITGRRQAEEALRNSEAILRASINATQESLVLIDKEGTVLLANDVVAGRLGTTPQDLIGSCLYDHFPPEVTGPRKEYFDRVAATGEIAHFIDTRAGRFYEIFAYPVPGEGQMASRVAIFAHDITERVHAEEEKVRLESQLRQSQKMEAVGTLAGGIAHDFNNILTAIIGFSTLLQMGMDNADPRKIYIEQLLAASEKAAHLTQGLLAFSRKQMIELKAQTINTILGGMEKLLKRLLTEDIEFIVIPAQPDVTIMADVTQIDQVLMNLATNAQDAMPKGGRLSIEARAIHLNPGFAQVHGLEKPGDYVLISVADTGAGMDETIKEKIFEPFFTTKEVGKGTGLGLSTVYGIIKQHEGIINVFSEPGRGTTFKIYLPAVKAEAEKPRQILQNIPGGTETILLAEDNNELRGLIREILSSKGYSVIETVDGDDAVEKFMEKKDAISLLVLDVVMPRRNGKEVYDEIRKARQDVKVIFISGYTGDVVLGKGIHNDAVAFISKPLSPGELLSKVREILDT